MKHASLFSGIGGFDLAADWMGWDNVLQVESDQFCQQVLKYYWPDADLYGDIKKTDFSEYEGQIDILTGGFPCQPYSKAGKRKGTQDNRNQWPQMLRAVQQVKPRIVLGENVPGLLSWNGGLVFEEVCADLEAQGYEVQPLLLPATGVNAPHRRERTFIVAYASGNRCKKREYFTDEKQSSFRGTAWSKPTSFSIPSNAPKPTGAGTRQDYGRGEPRQPNKKGAGNHWQNFPTQPPVCGGDDGLPTGLDGITFPKWRRESIKGYGNAIVPQVAFQIFKALNECVSTVKKD